MAGAGMTTLARVRLVDLVPVDGLASDRYKQAVAALFQSLHRFNAAIVQLNTADDVLFRCVMDSSRMYFHQRPLPGSESLHTDHLQDWNRSTGYFSEPQNANEFYYYRPGRTASTSESGEIIPAGLSELFCAMGIASRHILEAIASALDLRSFSFSELLDNMPLKNGEVSSSVLSLSCYNRPGFLHHQQHQHHHHQMTLAAAVQDQQQSYIYDVQQQAHAEKGLLTLMRSDKHGLQIRDIHGRWLVVDEDLGPQEVVLYSGLSLYQATAGHVTPAFLRSDLHHHSQHHHHHHHHPVQLYGKCSVAFKLVPRPTAVFHCSALTAANIPVGGPFQQPVSVHDFMLRNIPLDQIVGRQHAVMNSFQFSASLPAEASGGGAIVKASLKRRKQVSRGKPLAPSKRLRLEAQRVLKERVQEIAESKSLKIRFCNLKDCEENHLSVLDSPCAALRAELRWPAGVPFVHPHDLPNKAKEAFLEAYEPGWTAASQDLAHHH